MSTQSNNSSNNSSNNPATDSLSKPVYGDDAAMLPQQMTTKIWGVMPAAGIGARMGLAFPKQYLSIAGKTIIEHSMNVLLGLDSLQKLIVCVSKNDRHFETLPVKDFRVCRAEGGETRAISVLNGLDALSGLANDSDWVLVHDAARPCLEPSVLTRLIESVQNHEIGGILAVKAKDTLKLAQKDAGQDCIKSTLDRSMIWQAQTPQMFRYGVLRSSLRHCLSNELEVTDEASALERMGHNVMLVEGASTNLKVTQSEDRIFAEFLLTI